MNTSFLFSTQAKHTYALSMLKNHMLLASKSTNTINNYVTRISKIIQEFNRLPEECSKNELIGFLVKHKTIHGYKYSTIKNYVYALKYYLIHIAENFDLSIKIPCPKVKRYDFEILSIQNIKCLLDACLDSRQKLIIKLLYETGIRVSELEQLSLENIDFNFKSISILNSKNNKTRIVHFGKALENAIHVYLEDFPSLFSNSLLANKYHPFLPLTARGIYYNLKYIGKKAGIKKRISPHILRHTFAVHYLNFGGSIFQLQNLLGHEHMITTLNYLQYAILPECANISNLDSLNTLE